jgi:tripartite-type tricarboxylate transporter receptor subunit TctC
MFSTVPSALSAVRGGKVRRSPLPRRTRDPDVPDVPTFAESGMPDFEVISWQGLCTQAGVPQAALDRLRTALAAALALPETRKRLADAGFQPPHHGSRQVCGVHTLRARQVGEGGEKHRDTAPVSFAVRSCAVRSYCGDELRG